MRLDGPVLGAGDHAALRERCGRYLVVLCRFPGGLEGLVATMGLLLGVKTPRTPLPIFPIAGRCQPTWGVAGGSPPELRLGVFGRFAEVVPAAQALQWLPDAAAFASRDDVVVCAPPLDGAQALMLAEAAAPWDMKGKEAQFRTKLELLRALDASLALERPRAERATEDLVRYPAAARADLEARAAEVKPPAGEWNLYTRGGEVPHPDRLTSAIKGYASHSARVAPAPPLEPGEVEALLEVHDLLATRGFEDLAERLAVAALSSPAFACLCHRPATFAPAREPAVRAPWAAFGEALLANLLSEEYTHAARRDSGGERATGSSPFVLTLEEVLALGAPTRRRPRPRPSSASTSSLAATSARST